MNYLLCNFSLLFLTSVFDCIKFTYAKQLRNVSKFKATIIGHRISALDCCFSTQWAITGAEKAKGIRKFCSFWMFIKVGGQKRFIFTSHQETENYKKRRELNVRLIHLRKLLQVTASMFKMIMKQPTSWRRILWMALDWLPGVILHPPLSLQCKLQPI